MKVTVIIPTRNEEGCIGKVLRQIPRKIVNEVIIVDGNSTDKTVLEAEAALKKGDKLIHQKRTGYGAAFLEAIKIVKNDVVIMMDADGSHNPKDIKKIIEKISIW